MNFRALLKRLWIPATIIVVVFLVHLSMLRLYGASWDEPLHRNWGKLFSLFWRTGDNRFLEEMPGYGMYYSSSFYFIGWVVSEMLLKWFSLQLYQASHVLNIAVFALSCGVLFAMARRWFGPRIAWFTLLLFVLYPQLIAHAQYNPKDIPLLLMALPAVFCGLRVIERPTLGRAVLAGLAFGLCFVTKVSSVLLLPIFAVSYLTQLLLRSSLPESARTILRDSKYIPAFLIPAAVAASIAWPTLWSRPDLLIGGLKLFLSPYWPGDVMYLGTEYAGDKLPWHYIPFHFVLATPFIVACLAIAGMVVCGLQLKSRQHVARNALLLSWFLVPLILSTKPGLVRYDGIRQFFFTVPALLMMAAIGLDRLASTIIRRWSERQRFVAPGLAAVVACWLLIEISLVHPYEGSYVSEIGRLALGPHIEKSIDLEFWGPSYREGIEWLIANAHPNPVVCVPTAGVLVEWYRWRPDFVFECSKNTNYIMYFTRHSFSKEMLKAKLPPPVFTVSRYGSDLMYIYEGGR